MGFNATLIVSASADELYKRFYTDIEEGTYWALLRKDPTYNDVKAPMVMGTYGKQILVWYRAQPSINPYAMKNYLEQYHEAVKWLPKEYRSINRFKTYGDFEDFIGQTLPGLLESTKEERAKDGAKVLFEDEHWLVIQPKTHYASVYYADGAKWCTAYTDSSNYFNQYSAEGTLLMCVFKSNSEDSCQIFIPKSTSQKDPELKDYGNEWADVYEVVSSAVQSFISSKFGPDILSTLHDAYMADTDYEPEDEDEDLEWDEHDGDEDEEGPAFRYTNLNNGFSIHHAGLRNNFIFLNSPVRFPTAVLSMEDWKELDRSPYDSLVCNDQVSPDMEEALRAEEADYEYENSFSAVLPKGIWVNPVDRLPQDPSHPLRGFPSLQGWVVAETMSAKSEAKQLESGQVVCLTTMLRDQFRALAPFRFHEGSFHALVGAGNPAGGLTEDMAVFIDESLGLKPGTASDLSLGDSDKDPFQAAVEALEATVDFEHSMDNALVYTASAIVTFSVSDRSLSLKTGRRSLKLSWVDSRHPLQEGLPQALPGKALIDPTFPPEDYRPGYLDNLLTEHLITYFIGLTDPGHSIAVGTGGSFWVLPLADPLFIKAGWAKSEADRCVWYTKPA